MIYFLPVQRDEFLSIQDAVPVVVEDLAKGHAGVVARRGAPVLLHGL